MKTWGRKLVFFFCVGSLMALWMSSSFADGNAIDLTGRWLSLQYGSLTFTQSGNAFAAKWATVTATGTISGNTASFTFWSGSSYAASRDEDRGSGTLTLSANGNMLQGSWANVSKKDPESGRFSAVRLTSLFGDNPANASESGPALDGETNIIEGESERPGTGQSDSETAPTMQGQHDNGAGSAASAGATAPPAINPGTMAEFGLNSSDAHALFINALTNPLTPNGLPSLYGLSIIWSDAQRMGTELINSGSEIMKAELDSLHMAQRLRDSLGNMLNRMQTEAQQVFEKIHTDTLDILLSE